MTKRMIHILSNNYKILLLNNKDKSFLLDDLYIGTNQVVTAHIEEKHYNSPKATLYFVTIELSNSSTVEISFNNHYDAKMFLVENLGNGEIK